MTFILALWAALLSGLAPIRGLSISPVDGRTQVVIHVDGAVVRDFQLRDPHRLVFDLTGAQQGLSRSRFAELNRGGILGVRISQRDPNVVRVVLDLDREVTYTVERNDGEVRITFPNPAGDFEAWSTGSATPAFAARQQQPQQPQQLRPQQPGQQPAQQPATPNVVPPSQGRDVNLPVQAPARTDVIPDTRARDIELSTPAQQQPGRQVSVQQQARQQPRITVSFSETPILDVLSTFSEFSGRSIVAGIGVTGVVTADIRSQPWDVALKAILQAQGLDVQEAESGILQVDKLENLRSTERQQPLVTRQFKIKFINADSLLPALQGVKSDSGKVAVAKGTNTLIVTDRPAVMDRIGPLIQQLDVRTPQVTISAKIIFIDRTALEELGVTYDLKDSRGNQLNSLVSGREPGFDPVTGLPFEDTPENLILLGGNSIAGLGNATNRVGAPTLQLVSSLVLGRHSLVAFLDATQSLNLSDIQAAPVVTTLDNREASIQVGEQTPIRVIDAGGGAPGAPVRASIQLKNTGVILRVTPHITGDQVLMELHAERSNVGLAPGDIGLTFQTQEANTQVLVRDGETAVIGGLTIIEKSEARSGIPFLMDLPVVGALFRNTRERENKRDLLIMVTPHIVRNDDGSGS